MREKEVGKLTAPPCPVCGRWMDKIESWICKKCGKLKEK